MNQYSQVKVLIVDDIEDMRNILRRLLLAMGFGKVHVARNGLEALNLLRSFPIDIVVCDWNMPKMSGRELLEAVRGDPNLWLIPFIMLTGENSEQQVKSAVAAGVTDFIVKPFKASTLEHRLGLILNSATLPDAPESPSTERNAPSNARNANQAQ
jgi:two-component system chemotaxis response regulator CheY